MAPKASDAPSEWVLHHVGVATRDASAELSFWATIGYLPRSDLIHDPVQKVRVLFLGNDTVPMPLIELVEPAADDAPVMRFVGRSPRFYHLCFEVPDIAAALDRARRNRWLVVQQPVSAVAFDGRPIAWCYTASKDLIELVQRSSPAGR